MEQINKVIDKVAGKLCWTEYEFESEINPDSGNGFMSEMFLASLKNKATGEKVDLAFKCAFNDEQKRSNANTKNAFNNEITFYEDILPELLEFAKEKGLKENFDFFADYYASNREDGYEIIVMKNIKAQGFELLDRSKVLDEEHVKFVFETYGKFHGVSFAFKQQKPEKFQELMAKNLRRSEENGNKHADMLLKAAFVEAFDGLDGKIKEDCRRYCEDPLGIQNEHQNLTNSDHSCLLHGDCWSNNIMFKHLDEKITGVKLLDFQLTKEGSPVLDLSYFLYAGAPLKIYSNLDKFLKYYYDSYSKTVFALGSDPIEIMPWNALKNDWKKFCKLGVILSILIYKIKIMTSKDPKMTGIYKKRAKVLLEHTYKEGYLI